METLRREPSRVDDDVVAFLVQGGEQTLYFSKRSLMDNTPFFLAYFTRHAESGSDVPSNTVALKHVTAPAAEAALRLCHSRHHSDDAAFRAVQRDCITAAASPSDSPAAQAAALRHLLSLFEACVKFELYHHAAALSRTAAAVVTPATVLDVVRAAARYTTALPPEGREAVGLPGLLRACRRCIPPTWPSSREERRWRRLCEQHPDLPSALEAAVAEEASRGAAPLAAQGRPRLLLSPLKDEAAGGGPSPPPPLRPPASRALDTSATSDVSVLSTAGAGPDGGAATPLADVFSLHVHQTEELALAGQQRRRALAAEVAELREGGAALLASAAEDEAAAADSTHYLREARVYVQALRAAEAEMRVLCGTATAGGGPAPSSPELLHALRHALEEAVESATQRRSAVEEQIELEAAALHSLDVELAELQREAH